MKILIKILQKYHRNFKNFDGNYRNFILFFLNFKLISLSSKTKISPKFLIFASLHFQIEKEAKREKTKTKKMNKLPLKKRKEKETMSWKMINYMPLKRKRRGVRANRESQSSGSGWSSLASGVLVQIT